MKRLLIAVLFLHAWQALAQSPRGGLTGRVLTVAGDPAVGVTVTIQAIAPPESELAQAHPLRSPETDAAGIFRMDGIEPGEYRVVAGPNDLSISPWLRDRITVREGVVISVPDIVAARVGNARVRGRVTPSPGPLVAEEQWMRVAMVSSGYQPLTLETAVNADGSFQFSNVPSGPYLAYVLTGTASYMVPDSEPSPVIGVYVEDQDVNGLELRGPLALTGKVVVESDTGFPIPPGDPAFPPLAQLWIEAGSILRDGVTFPVRANLRADGDFTLFVSPREHRAFASRVPPDFAVKSLRDGNVDLTKEKLIVGSASQTDIQVVLVRSTPYTPGVTVRGRVSEIPPGGIPPGTRASTSAVSVPVDSSGAFEFHGIPPGPREIVLSRQGKSAFITFEGSERSSFTPVKVSIGTVDVNDVVLPWVPLVSVVVRSLFVDSTGMPVAGRPGKLTVTSREGQRIAPGCDVGCPENVLELGFAAAGSGLLPTGEFDVRVTGLPAGYTVKSLVAGGVDLMRQPLKIDAATVAVVVEASVEANVLPRVRVGGRIVNTIAAPLTPTHVSLSSTGPIKAGETSFLLKATVAANGTFEFVAVPPGAYALVAYPDGISVSGASITNIVVGSQAVENVPVVGVSETQVARSAQAANEAAAVQNLVAIQSAAYVCHEVGEILCDIPNFVLRGLLDPIFKGTVSGYAFAVTGATKDELVTARPVSAAAGRYVFYAQASSYGNMWYSELADAPPASTLARDARGQITAPDGRVLNRAGRGCGVDVPLCVVAGGAPAARPADSTGRILVRTQGTPPSLEGIFIGFAPEPPGKMGGALTQVRADGTFKVASPSEPGRVMIENIPEGFAIHSAKSGEVDLLRDAVQSAGRQALPPIEILLEPLR